MQATPHRRMRSAHRARGSLTAALAACLLATGPAAAAPVISGGDGDVWNAANPVPTYVITTTEADARVAWTMPGMSTQTGAAPVTVTLPAIADGIHTLIARELGNVDGDRTAQRTFRVDRTPPTIAIARPATGLSVPVGTALAADYACVGAVACTGTVAAGAPVDTSREGTHTFAVTALDDAGNAAGSTVTYTVVVAATPPTPIVPPVPTPTPTPSPPTPAPATPATPATPPTPPTPAAPAGGGTTAAPGATPVSPAPELRLATLNARLMRPRAGIRLATRRPVLRWAKRRGAMLYNVQIYRVTAGGRLTKVLSAFPRTTRLRVAPRRLSPGMRYIWRVWPYMGESYTSAPLGVSWFRVRG